VTVTDGAARHGDLGGLLRIVPAPWKGEGMCGRYASSRNPDALVSAFEVEKDATEGKAPGPDFNVAPTKPVLAVLTRREPDAAESAAPVRQLRVLRWGLVPSWAKDPSVGARMINARAETAAEKPSFRKAMASRRCLIPADGYYEWYQPEGNEGPKTKAGKPVKQPFYLHPASGEPLPMAGLYEFWRDRSRPDDDPLAWWTTCTVLTTDSTDGFGRIHDRTPMVVPPEAWADWLDPARGDAAELMVPATAFDLEAYPVSLEVNNVRNNGPSLVEPLPDAEVLPGVDWPRG
jgi:putative SOS response-associated peptidase YedK